MTLFHKPYFLLLSIFLINTAFSMPPAWLDLPAGNYANLAEFEDERFASLTDLVNDYQSISKQKEANLNNRIHALHVIIDFLSPWIKEERINYRRHFLTNISKIAENKRWYLTQLNERIKNGQFEKTYLVNYHRDVTGLTSIYMPIFLNNRRHYDSNRGEFWGEFWLESIDPCHRQLMSYYDLWTQQKGNKQPLLAFFLWLEDQNLSKDVPYLDYLTQEQIDNCTVIVQDGLLYLPSETGKRLVDYHQNNKEYIFNIDLAEKIVLIPASKKIKHVSLSHGKPLLGAGNMTVVEGEIRSIELESGHYLPLLSHAWQLLKILDDKGIKLDPTIPFSYYIGYEKHKVTVADVLAWCGEECSAR